MIINMTFPTPDRLTEHLNKMYEFPEDVPEDMKMKIHGLRQWVNELPDRTLVTNADIWQWLK
jgi:hypothetical protein